MPELSVVTTTYGQPKTLEAFLAALDQTGDEIEVVVVDDCGEPEVEDDPRIDVLLRVDQDIPWNQPGARNLGVAHTHSDVLLIVDCDMQIPPGVHDDLIAAARKLPHGRVIIPAIHSSGGQVNVVHPHNYLIRKNDLATLGGYDEDYCGHYGWEDVQMLHLMEKAFSVKRVRDLWVRHLDDVSDHAVSSLLRDDQRNHQLHLRKMAEMRRAGPTNFAAKQRQLATIRFPWHLVR